MLKIWLEPLIAFDGTYRVFAHLKADKVVGNAGNIKAGVPVGCWLTLPPRLHKLAPWLIKNCGFKHIGFNEKDVVLEKVE